MQSINLDLVVDVLTRTGTTRLTDLVDRGVVGGSLRVDATAKTRRSINLTVADRGTEWVPGGIGELLAPPSIVRIQMKVGDGPLVLLGHFQISRPSVEDAGGDLPIQVDGYDMSRSISRRRFRSPLPIADNTLMTDAIQVGILSRDATAVFNFAPSDIRLPAFSWGPYTNNDPWAEFTDMANEHSHQLFVDEQRRYVLHHNVDADTKSPEHFYIEGQAHTMVGLSRAFDDEPGYNWIVGRAEGPHLAAPLKSEWWDSDPASPTYAGVSSGGVVDPNYGADGAPTWGQVPWFFTSNSHTSQADLDHDVQVLGKEALRAEHTLSLSVLPDPTVKVDEVIMVQRDRSKVSGRWLTRSINLPFDGSAMSIECIGRPPV
jgi:hypothetical protein